jgi:hypothetical protein
LAFTALVTENRVGLRFVMATMSMEEREGVWLVPLTFRPKEQFQPAFCSLPQEMALGGKSPHRLQQAGLKQALNRMA